MKLKPTMTREELIEALQKIPSNGPVIAIDDNDKEYFITAVVTEHGDTILYITN